MFKCYAQIFNNHLIPHISLKGILNASKQFYDLYARLYTG